MANDTTINLTPWARLAVMAGLVLNVTLLAMMLVADVRLNSDFMAFWSFPRFVEGHDPRLIYDAQALMGFQRDLYPGFGSFYPYLYPPTLLLVTSWLGWLPYGWHWWCGMWRMWWHSRWRLQRCFQVNAGRCWPCCWARRWR